MNTVIDFLMIDDSLWRLDFSASHNLADIKKAYPEWDSVKTSVSDLESILTKKIKECFAGNHISRLDYLAIERHLALEYYVSSETRCINATYFLFSLNYMGIRLNSYNNLKNLWIEAKEHFQSLLILKSVCPDKKMFYERQKIIASSVCTLRYMGYDAVISSGKVQISESDDQRFMKAISYRFKQLGMHGLECLIMCLSKYYDEKHSRFKFRIEPGTINLSPLQVPWGYLFNVSLSYLNDTKMSNRQQCVFDECINISKHYFAAMELQTLSKFEDFCFTRERIIDDIQKIILFDQFFAIDQIASSHMKSIVLGIYNTSVMKPFINHSEIYLDIFNWITEQSAKRQPLVFTTDRIVHELENNYIDRHDVIISALKNLSFNKNKVNEGYLNPYDISKRNYYERPLISLNNQFIYLDKELCNFGFYFTISRELSKHGLDDTVSGKAIEEYVSTILKKSGIKFYNGVSYKISTDIAKELQITSRTRECDYIIETPKTLIFIELKRKTLTTAARSGNSVQSLVDLSQSFIHALVQAGCHDYCLSRNQELVFENGERIVLNDRNVERVCLSLFGFFGLQDDCFTNQLLISLLNAKLDSNDKISLGKIEKYLTELQNQYKTSLFQKKYCRNKYYDLSSFMNCRYLSIPQLLEILSNSSSNEEFERELKRTRHMTTGSKDWFFDYYYNREITESSN